MWTIPPGLTNIKSMSINWDNRGPRRGRRWVDLVRPQSGETVDLVAVSLQVEGVWLHWIDGQTVPCAGVEYGCPYHAAAREGELRWKGYFAAVKSLGGGVVYAELTEEAWTTADLLRRLSEQSTLRGVRVRLFRKRGGPRRPVGVVLPFADTRIERMDILPPPPDVRSAVSILWSRSVGGDGPNGEKES